MSTVYYIICFDKAINKCKEIERYGIIDALWETGLVESSIMLLIAMKEKGIKPNVVTFKLMNYDGEKMDI